MKDALKSDWVVSSHIHSAIKKCHDEQRQQAVPMAMCACFKLMLCYSLPSLVWTVLKLL